MVKYYNYAITFAEVPDEVALCFNITNCQQHCYGCHSSYLQQDIGNNLFNDIQKIINLHKDQFTCVCFLGEGNDHEGMQRLIDYVHNCNYKTCLYSGRDDDELNDYSNLDFYKKGSYQSEKGGLDKESTNQKMYKKNDEGEWEDITYKFFPNKML